MLAGIQRSANAKHDQDHDVSPERVRQFIRQGFDAAQDYLYAGLSTEQLSRIIQEIYPRRYAEFKGNPNSDLLNQSIWLDVETIIKGG